MFTKWARLLTGLFVFAVGLTLMIRADLGLSSWDVFHDALSTLTPISFGQAVVVTSLAVVGASWALGAKLGPGTIANVFLIGAFTDLLLLTGALGGLESAALIVRLLALVAGVVTIAVGTALYIGAQLGAGPRDSLMLAVAKRLNVSAGTARAGIELSVLLVGALLGGTVGLGTIVFAVLIGPAINIAFRWLKTV